PERARLHEHDAVGVDGLTHREREGEQDERDDGATHRRFVTRTTPNSASPPAVSRADRRNAAMQHNPWKLATIGLALLGTTALGAGLTTAWMLRPAASATAEETTTPPAPIAR